MKLSQVCFYAGVLSIPLSIALWFFAPEFSGTAYASVSDIAIRKAMEEAHSERWGMFVGLWPATLLLLSSHFDRKGE